LNIFLTWHENDPVSQKEIDRNNSAYSIQLNRNPFIDHPEYVFFIWGSAVTPGCPTTLPVELTSLEGEALPRWQSALRWTTATEEGSAHFIIEHSIDGQIFSPVGQVNAARYSVSPQSYAFTHEGAAKGDNYYRLRMVDMDGSEEYSKTIVVSHKKQAELFSLHPTITTGTLWVSLEEGTFMGELSIYDMQGRAWYSNVLETGDHALDIHHLSPGIYMVQFRSGALVETKRIFVK
jgi:hypothetical protein